MEDEDLAINETNGADISEEQVIEQQIVPFMGDDLAAALVPGGNIYITLAGMCIEVRLDALWEMVEDVREACRNTPYSLQMRLLVK